MGILEKIADIEREISKTQKNKATEHHLGTLKAKLAKYRQELIEPKAAKEKGEGFDVLKSGDARVALIGFPSVGKSTLLNKLTNQVSVAAAYEFTTLTCVPGKIFYNGATIQLLDLPGIIEGASSGKGRGRQVIACARTSDMILMMLDATKGEIQRKLLEKELESVGIRLNKRKPDVSFVLKKGGGQSFVSTCKLTTLTQKLALSILQQYKIFNCEIIVREDITVDEFIDVLVGNRKYMSCLYCYNKIDQISMEKVEYLASQPHSLVISSEQDLNLDFLLNRIWKYLQLKRVYTKKRSEYPDFTEGVIVRKDATVEHFCHSIHRTLADEFKYALVWGKSAKHNPQKVGLSHLLVDEDVVQIVK